jgi:hypothetical protein
MYAVVQWHPTAPIRQPTGFIEPCFLRRRAGPWNCEPQGMNMPWYKIAYKPEPNTMVHILWPLGQHPDREAALACFNAQEPNKEGIGPFKLDNSVTWSNYSLIEQQVLKGPEVMYFLDRA